MAIKDLKEGYEDYLSGAKTVENKGKYRSAVALYFKALCSLIDYMIKNELGKIPKNHAERFRITEDSFPEVYKILDSIFGTYRKAYRKGRKKHHVEKIKDGIKKVLEIRGLDKKFEGPY